MIPFNLSFGIGDNWNLEYLIAEIIIDLMFLIDIFLMFLTTTQDIQGYEITDAYKIAIKYISTR